MEFQPADSTLSRREYWATVSTLCLAGAVFGGSTVTQVANVDTVVLNPALGDMALCYVMAIGGILRLSKKG